MWSDCCQPETANVSPGKTWEGTLFGIFITIALCFYFHKNIQATTSLSWIFLSFLIPILATLGDLVEYQGFTHTVYNGVISESWRIGMVGDKEWWVEGKLHRIDGPAIDIE